MRLLSREMSDWPPLAWLAACSGRMATVRVLHGSGVEVRDEFACEAVWPASFEEGDFDRAAVVAGSGIRVRGEEVVFVSATSTVDRLHSVVRQDGPVVSNSLPCLMRALGLEARVDYWRYLQDLQSITRGVVRYRRTIPTTGDHVRLTYFHNLVWAGGELAEREKPLEPTGFADFSDYVGFLRATLAGIARNMVSSGRRRPYEFLGTLSSGYDAPAVTTLGAEVGCAQAVCFDESRTREPDSGVPIAHALGIEPLVIKRATWRRRASRLDQFPEATFLAAMPSGHLASFGAARDHLHGRVLLTGFFGGVMWDLKARDPTPHVERQTFSGLTLTEFRLGAGFINCPVPFWAARQKADVVAISRSEEMRDWIVGEHYQRPIPRRIVEAVGVPRDAFGYRKQPGVGGSLLSEHEFLGPESVGDYRAWVRSRASGLSNERLVVLAAADRLARGVGWLAGATLRAHRRRATSAGRVWRRIEPRMNRAQPREYGIAGRLFTFQWALGRVGERYVLPPDEAPASPAAVTGLNFTQAAPRGFGRLRTRL